MELLDKRISRIVGQLRGIQKMIKSDRDRIEVLQQISAVKNAIDGLTKEILILYFKGLVPPEKLKDVEKMLKQSINL